MTNAVYQRFDLDQNRVVGGKFSSEEKERLIRPLREKGYHVLEGLTAIDSMPTEIIVGAPEHRSSQIKEDFFRAAQEVDAPYRSGPAYMESFPRGS